MSGNEAFARGAYEAGATVGVGYPGTPSTEILENFKSYPGVYTEWSINEKTAMEVGIGAALAGARTIVTMKHVGLNVAADPLFTSAYIGVNAGLVIIVADDPDMHSSQNEQDSRHYAVAAKVPMLEPSDSQEAKEFILKAFELSEMFDTPVLVRGITRLSHGRSVATLSNPLTPVKPSGFVKNPKKYVMIPVYARARHVLVEKRLTALAEYAETCKLNHEEINNNKIGIITSGICYQYVKDSLPPTVSILKLGMVNPLPRKLITAFCTKMEKVFIVEELDPVVEQQIRAWGITNVVGKDMFPILGEYSPALVKQCVTGEKMPAKLQVSINIPPRPPQLCPGCPHRSVFTVLHELGLTVSGDIGCYTLGVLPPFNAMDTCIEMGASIGVAQGIEIVESRDKESGVVAVLGDSTFAHSGITGLVNAAYNKRHLLIIVLDNGTTAMTGLQPNPLSGTRIDGTETVAIDYHALGKAVGIGEGNVKIVGAYDMKTLKSVIQSLLATKKLALLVVKDPCMILKRKHAKHKDIKDAGKTI